MAEHRIRVENADLEFAVSSEDIILDGALRQGILLPHQCRGASCGTCKAKLLEGQVDHGWNFGFALTEEEKAEGYCLLCQSKPLSERVRVETVNPVLGVKRQAIVSVAYVVIGLSKESVNVCRVVLVPQNPAKILRYRAGAYAELGLPGITANRSYSFATRFDEADSALTFYVSRHPGGQASEYIHNTLRAGDVVEIKGPYGTFGLPPQCEDSVLALAGGTGLAPILAIAEEALANEYLGTFELLFSVRGPQDVFALERLYRLRQRHLNFSFRLAYTRAPAAGVSQLAGRIPALLPTLYTELSNHWVLLAGSPGFVDGSMAAALKLGARVERIRFDRFTPTTTP